MHNQALYNLIYTKYIFIQKKNFNHLEDIFSIQGKNKLQKNIFTSFLIEKKTGCWQYFDFTHNF